MKILKVNYGLPGFAGDSNQLFSIIKQLNSNGHEITIVTTDADIYYFDKQKSKQYSEIKQILEKSIEKPIKINNVPVIPLHCTFPQLGMYCLNATNFAKKIVKNYDVVHIYNWYYHLGMTFAKVCFENSVPFVISFYASLQEEAYAIKQKRKKVLDFLYTKKLILKANALHSAGDLETQEYVKRGVNINKIFRIDNAVDLSLYELKKSTNIFNRLNIDSQQDYLLFLSRIHPKKGLDLLIHAFFSLLKDGTKITLVIAGTGNKKYENEIKDLVDKLRIKDFVKFTGFVTHEEKLDLLKHAKVFVLTSRSDLHPIAIQDALAMGTPVLVTEACDYPEITEYEAGVIVNSTIDSVYEGLSKILSEDLNELSANAIQLIKEKFLINNLINKYEKMYQTIIK